MSGSKRRTGATADGGEPGPELNRLDDELNRLDRELSRLGSDLNRQQAS